MRMLLSLNLNLAWSIGVLERRGGMGHTFERINWR